MRKTVAAPSIRSTIRYGNLPDARRPKHALDHALAFDPNRKEDAVPEPAPRPPSFAVTVQRGIEMPMRDGTILRGHLYLPTGDGPFPALVERVAYELESRCSAVGSYYAGRGYAVVGQNVRGALTSEGVFQPFVDDAWGVNRDGHDTIEWIASQPWCDGNVGMLDGSYSGFTQYYALPTRPPHLRACYVREGGNDFYHDWSYNGGAFRLAWLVENALGSPDAFVQHGADWNALEPIKRRLASARDEIEQWYRHLPLQSVPPLEGVDRSYLQMLAHPDDGPHWWPLCLSLQLDEIDTPVLHLGGWFDIFCQGTLRGFAGIRQHGRSAFCRANQRLIIGPWIHGPGNVGRRDVGELDFGPQAAFDLFGHRLRWYDHWLKGMDTGIMDEPVIQVFLMGSNQWLALDDWPPPAAYTEVYLREGAGPSDASLNGGRLSVEPPAAFEPPDRYAYDPEDPVPSLLLGFELGPRDHAPVEGSMLTYTSDVLSEDLPVVGPIKAVLHASSSAPDTDWVVRLCDVWPDGRAMSVCDGILRARYRNGFHRPERLTPDRIYQFTVELGSTAQLFARGHRIRVEVTSSDFPRHDRNLNTGGPLGQETAGQVAHNVVFHDAEHRSHLLLPIYPSPSPNPSTARGQETQAD